MRGKISGAKLAGYIVAFAVRKKKSMIGRCVKVKRNRADVLTVKACMIEIKSKNAPPLADAQSRDDQDRAKA